MSNQLLDYPKRHYGMDHDRYEWSMLQDRNPVTWPGGKPLALWINISVQHFPLSGDKPAVAPPGALTMPYPDLRHYTLRDYGNRVGIYRLLKLMAEYEASPSLAISGALAERLKLVAEPDAFEALSRALETGIASGLKKGETVTYLWHSPGHLRVFVRGKSYGNIENASLPRFIHLGFLGADPKSPEAKEEIPAAARKLFGGA